VKSDNVRVIDRNGKFIAWLTPERAKALAEGGKGTYTEQGKRRGLLTLKADVQDFETGFRSQDARPTYREKIAGQDVVSLKLVTAEGSFRRYGDNLTFADLRAGRTRHKTSQAERIEQLERAA
jgi:hypothetical protein